MPVQYLHFTANIVRRDVQEYSVRQIIIHQNKKKNVKAVYGPVHTSLIQVLNNGENIASVMLVSMPEGSLLKFKIFSLFLGSLSSLGWMFLDGN